MKAITPCVTCPHRDLGFCGALLNELSESPLLHEDLDWQHYRAAHPGDKIVTRNQVCEDVFVLCGGWAFRFFQLPNGRRQILNFLLPGDLFSAPMAFDKRVQFSVEALTEIQASGFRRMGVQARLANNPVILTALASSCSTELEAANELSIALGQRSAEERIAYLFLHLMQRIAAQGVIREERYRFPLRQQHIADAVGLTAVHVNRVLSLFRERGIVVLSHGVLQVLNRPELELIGALN
jgi:CRP/FNR family transcriptional regulator